MKEQLSHLTSADIRANTEFHQVEPNVSPIDDFAATLRAKVFGQDEACFEVAKAIMRGNAGLGDVDRPIGTLMFLGPTGVGKTEISKVLAQEMAKDLAGWNDEKANDLKLLEDARDTQGDLSEFEMIRLERLYEVQEQSQDWKKRFIKIDCTDFKDDADLSRLEGAAPQYVGYGDPLLINPEDLPAVVVFDEIEKAHESLWKWLMPVLEEGEVLVTAPTGEEKRVQTTRNSEEVGPVPLDFRTSIIICTSNAASEELQKARTGRGHIGYRVDGQGAEQDQTKVGLDALKKTFKAYPEFLARFDSTVVFKELGEEQYRLIIDKFIDEVNRMQEQRDPYGSNFIALTQELKTHVIDHATDREYGARNLRHVLQDQAIMGITDLKLGGVLNPGNPIIADIEDGKIVYWTSDINLLPPLPVQHLVPISDADEPQNIPISSSEKKDLNRSGETNDSTRSGTTNGNDSGGQEKPGSPLDLSKQAWDAKTGKLGRYAKPYWREWTEEEIIAGEPDWSEEDEEIRETWKQRRLKNKELRAGIEASGYDPSDYVIRWLEAEISINDGQTDLQSKAGFEIPIFIKK